MHFWVRFWGLHSKHISRVAVWASFAVGIGLTAGNMVAGLFGVPLIVSPINCGTLAILLSFIVVPLVSLVTKPVSFRVDVPSVQRVIDREYTQELEMERIINPKVLP